MPTKVLAPLALALALALVGCGKGGSDAGGPEKGGPEKGGQGSAMTVDQFREAANAYVRAYEKEHPSRKDFAECPTKDEFYAKFGTPERVAESGDYTFLHYRCKDGTARVKANTGIFKSYRRVQFSAVEQSN